MRAYRYNEFGVLVEVQDQGVTFAEHERRPPVPLVWYPALYDRPRVRTGIHELDLEREAHRSGVPAWWRPWLSRRQRCATWCVPAARRERRPVDLRRVSIKLVRFDGHMFGCRVARDHEIRVLLYLPAGERPTEQHALDLTAFILADARPLTVADLDGAVPELLLKMAVPQRVALEVQQCNDERPYPTPQQRCYMTRAIEYRLRSSLGLVSLLGPVAA